MSLIRTLVVDDEPLAREGLALLLGRDAQIQLVGQCGGGKEALALLEREAVDLLFLDIQMPGMTGFDVLSRLSPHKVPVVVFVTAFDTFALQAFKVHALDYLLKPYTDREFFEALSRAKSHITLRSLEPLAAKMAALLADQHLWEGKSRERYISRIAVTHRGKITPVSVEEIDWIEAADDYVNLHQGGKSHLVRETLANLEAKLDPEKFTRIHRSFIVRLDAVRELQGGFGGTSLIILRDGTELKLGKTYRQEITRRMQSPK